MRRPRLRARLVVALPLLTIAVFFVLLIYSLVRLALTQHDMRLEAPHNNLLWVISQAQTSSLRLAGAVGQTALGTLEPGALARHHQVLVSRLALMDEGPQLRQLQALGYAGRLRDFRQDLPELARLLDRLRPGQVAVAAEIDALLAPLQQTLTQAATQAMVAEWDDLGDKLEASRAGLRQVIFFLVGLLLAGAALSVHLLQATRRARRHAHLLSRAKAFSERIVSSSAEAIIAIDLARRCTVCNEAAERLFGRPAHAVVGAPLQLVAPLFDVATVVRAMDRALAGELAVLHDQPFFRSADAPPRYLELRCAPIHSGTQIVGAIVMSFDTTEQRAAQREIAMHRDHLEELVQARTRELDAALARERQAAELYRNFGAMISHQFRTPLAIVDSALQRLMRHGGRLSEDEIRERSGRARDAVARLIGLIESTLDAARLDAGHMAVHGRVCQLAELAADACEQQRQQTPERQIVLDVPADGCPPVFCDPVQTDHILGNLLSNAARYAPPGTPLQVSLRRSGARVECAVGNHGALAEGVDPALLFERYYRGSDSRGHPGVGIGLYMARSLARLQGGELALQADTPGMVTFVLALPVADAATPAPPAPRLESAA
ncbi:MAG: ATP-binding protein [Ottowia sp.]